MVNTPPSTGNATAFHTKRSRSVLLLVPHRAREPIVRGSGGTARPLVSVVSVRHLRNLALNQFDFERQRQQLLVLFLDQLDLGFGAPFAIELECFADLIHRFAGMTGTQTNQVLSEPFVRQGLVLRERAPVRVVNTHFIEARSGIIVSS